LPRNIGADCHGDASRDAAHAPKAAARHCHIRSNRSTLPIIIRGRAPPQILRTGTLRASLHQFTRKGETRAATWLLAWYSALAAGRPLARPGVNQVIIRSRPGCRTPTIATSFHPFLPSARRLCLRESTPIQLHRNANAAAAAAQHLCIKATAAARAPPVPFPEFPPVLPPIRRRATTSQPHLAAPRRSSSATRAAAATASVRVCGCALLCAPLEQRIPSSRDERRSLYLLGLSVSSGFPYHNSFSSPCCFQFAARVCSSSSSILHSLGFKKKQILRGDLISCLLSPSSVYFHRKLFILIQKDSFLLISK
jgi:hypothetical protein